MNSTILSAGCLELMPAFDLDRVLRVLEAGRVTKFFWYLRSMSACLALTN